MDGLLASRLHTEGQPPQTPLQRWQLTPGDKNLNAIIYFGISNSSFEEEYDDRVELVLKYRRAIFRDNNLGREELLEIFNFVKDDELGESGREFERWEPVAMCDRTGIANLLVGDANHYSFEDRAALMRDFTADYYCATRSNEYFATRSNEEGLSDEAADAPPHSREQADAIIEALQTPSSSSSTSISSRDPDRERWETILSSLTEMHGSDRRWRILRPTPPGSDFSVSASRSGGSSRSGQNSQSPGPSDC